MKSDCQQIEGMIDKIPKEISVLRGTLTEMKKASEPVHADYWDERSQIRNNLEDLATTETYLEGLVKKFKTRKDDGHRVSNDVVAAGADIKVLKAEVQKLETVVQDLQGMITEFTQKKLAIADVQKKMHDCMVPVNVEKRRHELDYFSEALERLKSDFADAVKADDAYAGSAETEAAIREARRKVQPKIAHFEKVEADMEATLRNKFEAWT
jgi:chromosome segregation ATPase